MLVLNIIKHTKEVTINLVNYHALFCSQMLVIFSCMFLLISDLTLILLPLSIAAEIVVKYFVHHVFEKLAHHDVDIYE